MEGIERKSNFELLRIISMILIVMSHYVKHSGIFEIECNVNRLIAQFIFIGGKLGVLLFILISGYFLVNSKFNTKKLLKLILETFTYSVIIYIILILCGRQELKINTLINSILPIITGQYFFITAYVGMYILFPVINLLIKKINKDTYKKVLIILTCLLYIIPTFTTKNPFGNDVMQFIYIYMIGAYIKIYNIKNKEKGLKIGLTAISVIYLSSIVFSILGKKISLFEKGIIYFASQTSLLILIAAIGIFCFFEKLEIQNKKINFISKATLGVYLIHDNRMIRDVIWKDILKVQEFFYSTPIIFLSHFVISIIIVYSTCTLIDLLRIYCIENKLFKIKRFDKYINKIDNFMFFGKEEENG